MKSNETSPSAPVLKKSQPEEFDLVILGGGRVSTIAAWTFAGEGKRVAVIDRKYIGGSCPNIACLPSKNIIHSAKVARSESHRGHSSRRYHPSTARHERARQYRNTGL